MFLLCLRIQITMSIIDSILLIGSYLMKPDDYKKIQSCDYQRGTEKTHRDQKPIEVMDNCL